MLNVILEARNIHVDEHGRYPRRAYITTDELPSYRESCGGTEYRGEEGDLVEGMFVVIRDEPGPRVGM